MNERKDKAKEIVCERLMNDIHYNKTRWNSMFRFFLIHCWIIQKDPSGKSSKSYQRCKDTRMHGYKDARMHGYKVKSKQKVNKSKKLTKSKQKVKRKQKV